MSELKATTRLVKEILEKDKQARNSDSFLYFRVLEYHGEAKGVDIHSMSIPNFLLNMADYGFPAFETVRRTRQKVQAEFPELDAEERVRAWREANEEEYREFAIDDLPY